MLDYFKVGIRPKWAVGVTEGSYFSRMALEMGVESSEIHILTRICCYSHQRSTYSMETTTTFNQPSEWQRSDSTVDSTLVYGPFFRTSILRSTGWCDQKGVNLFLNKYFDFLLSLITIYPNRPKNTIKCVLVKNRPKFSDSSSIILQKKNENYC